MNGLLRRLSIEALEIQNACNLCGLAQRYAKVLVELQFCTNGTEERNKHPISIVWLDKMCSLAGIQVFSTGPWNTHANKAIEDAYKQVEAWAKGE